MPLAAPGGWFAASLASQRHATGSCLPACYYSIVEAAHGTKLRAYQSTYAHRAN
jgi:hypothetical protein